MESYICEDPKKLRMLSRSIIDYRNVNIYNGNRLVLENVDFRMAKAEFIYLTGKNGSGKSTFLKSLYKEALVSGEKALVIDHDLLSITPEEIPFLRRKIGMIFQDYRLFEDWTILANLDFVAQALGYESGGIRTELIDKVLESTSLLVDREEKVHNLSEGQKRKLAVARALLNSPSIIIADEPIANLDDESAHLILKLLHRVNKDTGAAILMATHDRRTISLYPAREFRVAERKLDEVVS